MPRARRQDPLLLLLRTCTHRRANLPQCHPSASASLLWQGGARTRHMWRRSAMHAFAGLGSSNSMSSGRPRSMARPTLAARMPPPWHVHRSPRRLASNHARPHIYTHAYLAIQLQARLASVKEEEQQQSTHVQRHPHHTTPMAKVRRRGDRQVMLSDVCFLKHSAVFS